MVTQKRGRKAKTQPPQKKIKTNHDSSNAINNSFDICHDVLDHIFSFFSIKSAIRIGVLSTRFKNSWVLNRNLNFNDKFARDLNQEDLIRIIDRVWKLHLGSKVCSFRLLFDSTRKQSKVEEWISHANKKEVEELDLDFSQGKNNFKFHCNWLDRGSVLVLKLFRCKFEYPLKFNGLPSLTTLVLRQVYLTDQSIQAVICNCLVLENLDLSECCGIKHLKISTQNLKWFKNLKIGDCWPLFLDAIDSPTLSSLHYSGGFQYFDFAFNISNLKDVMLSFKPRTGFMQPSYWKNLISDLAYLSVLTINSTVLEALAPKFVHKELIGMQISFENLKEFQLLMERESYCNPYDIVLFLKNCPCLERVFIDLNDFSFECGMYWEFHARQSFEDFLHFFRHLKYVKVKGFKFQKHEIQLVKFFLEKAVILETLALVTPRNQHPKIPFEDILMCDQLVLCQRASPNAKIVVFEHSNDMSFLHPKHTKV